MNKKNDAVDDVIVEITNSLIAQEFKVPEIAKKIVQIIKRISEVSTIIIYLRDKETKVLKSIAKEGFLPNAPQELTYDLNVKIGVKKIGLTAYVAITGETFSGDTYDEIVKHPAHWGKYDEFLYKNGERGESILIEPLKLGNDTIGVLKVEDREPYKFSKSFKSMFKMMANLVALTLSSAQEIKRKDEFLISLGHELGLPATGLVSLSKVMWKRYSKEFDEEIEDKDVIKVSRKRLLNYCENLRTEAYHLRFLTKGRAALDSKAQYEFEKQSLKWTISEVRSILQSLANWKHIDINFDLEKTPNINILMDKEKLKQAFYNVVQNAIKYSPNNSIIDIEMMRKGDIIVIIKDNGIGVTKGEEKIIFDKYSRGNNASEVDPTSLGLGLYYAKMIIERHNGGIELTHNQQPTIFTITFKE